MYEDYVHYITKGYFNRSSKKIVEYLTKFYCDKTINELIVPTKKAYDLFKEKYNIQRNIHIIPTGIEVDRFYEEKVDEKEINKLKRKYNIKKNDFTLIFVGRIAEEKNVPYIIEVMEEIIKEKNNIKLLIIGDGPDKEKYEKIVKKTKTESNITFTGKVPWNKIPTYYHLGSAFISASTTETQGLTIIEAMAASLPALCINDESFNGTVVNDLNGYLFNDKKECKEAILKLANNKKLTKYLSNGARTSAEQHSAKYFAEKVLDVYKIAIKNKKPSYKEKISNFFRKVLKKWNL